MSKHLKSHKCDYCFQFTTGFETVTIAFQGEVEHADSVGNRDVIKSGDVQWMTAGRGIIHQEYHSKEFSITGGIFEMCQLWVDLPKEKKMTKPRYQAISSNKIPQVAVKNNADGQTGAIVKIIAGVFNDVKGPAKTFSPVELYDVKLLSKNVTVDLPFPANNQCVVFSRTGSVDLHYGNNGELKETIDKHGVALLKNDLDNNSASEVADKKVFIRLSPKKDNTSVLIMGGEPLNQPIVNRGPFVMTTQKELEQAMKDYYSGKMGR
eukprot:CAMPEP_0178966170 /NCGR_PEP_ID=MMETSP0789-20121207/16762_1 /TAXON_ID=3005 /ORGANISM="Rhizosolenia setigera, Strain CCMP 1694" /LENGTH=264 /DNA_ID=CAMNT_0020651383 /DNA_START=339 /DNA_END=1133 /DNA_ORIENTATION=-